MCFEPAGGDTSVQPDVPDAIVKPFGERKSPISGDTSFELAVPGIGAAKETEAQRTMANERMYFM